MGKGDDPNCAAAAATAMVAAYDTPLTAPEQITLETYERQAARWSDARDGDPRFWSAELEDLMTMLPGRQVVDVGSGSGRDAAMMTNAGLDVTGLDISPALLNVAAAACPQARFVRGSVYEMPFAAESFDGVWAAAVLLHLPKDRVGGAARELTRVLRPGGAAFIAVKLGVGERLLRDGLGERFFAYYQPDELTGMLQNAGLTVDRVVVRDGGTRWVTVFARRVR